MEQYMGVVAIATAKILLFDVLVEELWLRLCI